MKEVTMEERILNRLMDAGAMKIETTGWGTGKVSVKCKSNTKEEVESLNKPTITFLFEEEQVTEDTIENRVMKELCRKLSEKEIKVMSVEEKRLAKQKKQFKAWKASYKKIKSTIE